MTGDRERRHPGDSLRRRAESRVANEIADISSMSEEDIASLVHELRVHQIELEMQNEEMRKTQEALVDSRDRLFGFYELAPVGYMSLDHSLCVRSANLAAADLLQTERDALVGMRVETLVHREDRSRFYVLLRRAAGSSDLHRLDVRLDTGDDGERWVRFEVAWMRLQGDEADEYRVTVYDVTSWKRAEEALRAEQQGNLERERDVAAALNEVVDTELAALSRNAGRLAEGAEEGESPGAGALREFAAGLRRAADGLRTIIARLPSQ